MGYNCLDCGNDDKFKGHQDSTEYITEGIIVNSDQEILDCLDKDVTDSETNETRIESCNFCESKNIKWIEGIELTQWQDENFDENGNFKKSSPKTKENPGQFSSIEKLKLINDQLLKNEITIEEYRQRVQEARKEA